MWGLSSSMINSLRNVIQPPEQNGRDKSSEDGVWLPMWRDNKEKLSHTQSSHPMKCIGQCAQFSYIQDDPQRERFDNNGKLHHKVFNSQFLFRPHLRSTATAVSSRNPSLQKGSGVPERTCCRQPASSIPSSWTCEDNPGTPRKKESSPPLLDKTCFRRLDPLRLLKRHTS